MKKIQLLLSYLILIFVGSLQAQTVTWAGELGSLGRDNISAMHTNNNGETVLAGVFSFAHDYDVINNQVDTADYSVQTYVSKNDANGNLLWYKTIESGNVIPIFNVAQDVNGNVIITGRFFGTVDFNPSTSLVNNLANTNANADMFVLKLDSNGDFVWAAHVVCNDDIDVTSMDIDASGNSYLFGNFKGVANFDVDNSGQSSHSFTANSTSDDNFIVKLSSSGADVWAYPLGGNDQEQSGGLSLDKHGHLYLAGIFDGAFNSNPKSGGVHTLINNSGNSHGYIIKLDTQANFIWSKKLGELTSSIVLNEIESDGIEHIFLSGGFDGTVDFDPSSTGVESLTNVNDNDHFVLCLDSASNFNWVRQISFNLQSELNDLKAGNGAGVYLTGGFENSLDLGTSYTSVDNKDLFVCRLSSTGGYVDWFYNTGSSLGTNDNYGKFIDLDANNNIYTAGFFNGEIDLEPGSASVTINTANGGSNYVAKYDQSTFVSIAKVEHSEESFVIYPNPNNGDFIIDFQGSGELQKIEIFDILGKLKFYKEIDTQGEINVSSALTNGIYLVEITGKQGTSSKLVSIIK